MEGMNRMPRPTPERELESQAHRETPEVAAQRELNEAIKRTLSGEEHAAFLAAVEPGIAFDERQERIEAFNSLKAGTPDDDEPLEGREHDAVPMNFGGITYRVSRARRGAITLELPR